jgi:hypothetical protein
LTDPGRDQDVREAGAQECPVTELKQRIAQRIQAFAVNLTKLRYRCSQRLHLIVL